MCNTAGTSDFCLRTALSLKVGSVAAFKQNNNSIQSTWKPNITPHTKFMYLIEHAWTWHNHNKKTKQINKQSKVVLYYTW
jgi:hypothetical protein